MSMAKTQTKATLNLSSDNLMFDPWLLFATVTIIVIGLVMVASSSIVVSEQVFHSPFHYLIRQFIYLILSLIVACIVVRVEIDTWQKHGGILLILGIILLVMVLIPGIGREVNGSRRWIGLGPIGLQVSELVKFFTIIYMAGYLVRHEKEVQQSILGFIKPMLLLGVMSLLLLKEPDFGAAVVIITTALGMMFLARVRFWQFLSLFAVVLASLGALAVSSPYRLERLTTFLNPWTNQYDGGYQLTQSLIAFGRGGWFGVGLGQSIQKLFYLPEAHTDFLFAIYAEEMGLIGVLIVMSLFAIIVARAMKIAIKAKELGRTFASFIAFGFALWLGLQAMINIGVNTGVLPTKGLTLPLMSYGGSSMIVMCTVIAILFRIDYECRLK